MYDYRCHLPIFEVILLFHVYQLFGLTNRCYVTEHTEIDPRNKVMKVLSRNVSIFILLGIL